MVHYKDKLRYITLWNLYDTTSYILEAIKSERLWFGPELRSGIPGTDASKGAAKLE